MILVGQYDSPFVRRVAVSLGLLGMRFEQEPLSVFGDATAMRRINPLGRVPSLRLDDGEVIVDSFAILDWLDEQAGPERALLPRSGPARREQLGLVALGVGIAEKAVQFLYETRIRPPELCWSEWAQRLRLQVTSTLAVLGNRQQTPWLAGERIGQADVTLACALRFIEIAVPKIMPESHPRLAELSARCEALPAFRAVNPQAWTGPKAAGDD